MMSHSKFNAFSLQEDLRKSFKNCIELKSGYITPFAILNIYSDAVLDV